MRIRWRGEGEGGRDDYLKAREGPREGRGKGILLRTEVVVFVANEAVERLPAQHDILYHGDRGVPGADIWSSYSLGIHP